MTPVIAAGKIFQMLRSVAVLAGHDMLSALAFNIWWIVSYVFMAAAARVGGLRAAISLGGINLRTCAMAAGFEPSWCYCFWQPVCGLSRPRGMPATSVFTGLAAFVLWWRALRAVGAGAREPLFLALPLLAVASALRPLSALCSWC